MKQHSRSFAHALTEEDLASTDTEKSGDEIWKESDMHGMEVNEDESLWKCVRQGCKGYQKTMKNLGNAKSHFNSDAHLIAAEEVGSSDEPLEEVDGMERSEDGTWRCVKSGCSKLGTTYRLLSNAKRHCLTETHVLAEEESSPDETEEELDGVEYQDEMAAWVCTRAACKRYRIPITHLGFARQHARCATHIKAGENTVTSNQPPMPLFTTPRRATQSAANSLLTPMEMADSTAHVSPGSPSAGRGLTLVTRAAGTPQTSTATQTPKQIRHRRSSATNPGVEKRIRELKKESQELKERVANLEGQMAQVLEGKSPEVPRSSAPGFLAPNPSAAPVSHAASSSLSSAASSGQMESLSKFARQEFRPIVSMEVDEDELWNVSK
ncbi:hypothetical protein ACLX1H_005787 [Fusarium chlamydosporum]